MWRCQTIGLPLGWLCTPPGSVLHTPYYAAPNGKKICTPYAARGCICIGITSSFQVHVVKMLYRPQSQCFQHIHGPRYTKPGGRVILLFGSHFPKPPRLAPTRPQFTAQPSQRPSARQQNSFAAFRAVPLAHPGRRGGVFLCPFCLPGQCQPPGAESQ